MTAGTDEPARTAARTAVRAHAPEPVGTAWLVCPVCDMRVVFEACHTRCPRCHTLVESCSDGGMLPPAAPPR